MKNLMLKAFKIQLKQEPKPSIEGKMKKIFKNVIFNEAHFHLGGYVKQDMG